MEKSIVRCWSLGTRQDLPSCSEGLGKKWEEERRTPTLPLVFPCQICQTPELASLVDCRSAGLGHKRTFAFDLLWVVGQGTATRWCLRSFPTACVFLSLHRSLPPFRKVSGMGPREPRFW